MSKDDKCWLTWLIAVVASFAYLEGRAVRRRPELTKGERTGTLTSSLQSWGGVNPKKPRRFVFAAVIGAFCVYLYGHLVHSKWMF